MSEKQVSDGWLLVHEESHIFAGPKEDTLRLVRIPGVTDEIGEQFFLQYGRDYLRMMGSRLAAGRRFLTFGEWSFMNGKEFELVDDAPTVPGTNGPVSIGLMVDPRKLKGLREILNRLTAAASLSKFPHLIHPGLSDIQLLINEIDRHRPLGPDGTHGNLHTASCGCEDKPHPWKAPKMCPSNPCRAKDCRKQHDD